MKTKLCTSSQSRCSPAHRSHNEGPSSTAWSSPLKACARVTFLSVAMCIGVLSSAASAPAQSRQPAVDNAVQVPAHHEWPHDPYLPNVPRRVSPPAVVERGPFTSVQVNVDGLGNNILGDAANEPSIAIDPINPDRMAIGWRQFDNVASDVRQAGYAYSSDAGSTWTFPGVLQPGVFRSDPVLDSDADGNFYYSSLSHNCPPKITYCVDYFISSDGGETWGRPHYAFGGDKQWFVVDKTASPGRGNLYQAWTGVAAHNSYYPYQFNWSVDHGVAWADPRDYPYAGPMPYYGTLAVAANGDLYISGYYPPRLHVAKSTDAKYAATAPPPTFSSEWVDMGGSFMLPSGSPYNYSWPNPAGLHGQPWVAVDKSTGPTAHNVYLLCSVNPPGADPLNVMFSRSDDGGHTWSAPVQVNDDADHPDSWQWFGTMSVAPNGRIDVIWNDTRNSLQANISELFYAFSTNGGRTWSDNVAVSPPFDSHVGWPHLNPKLGDYYDMVSDNFGASVAYSATFNDEQDVYFLRICGTVITDCDGNGVADQCEYDFSTLYVDWAYAGPCENGLAAYPFNTVGEANEWAMDGTTIIIQAGDYPETLTFSKRLWIEAQGGLVRIGG